MRRKDRRSRAGRTLLSQKTRLAISEEAVSYCLKQAGIDAARVEHVTFYDKPFLKFERLLETYMAFAPRGFESFRMAIPVWLREKLYFRDLLGKELPLTTRMSTGTRACCSANTI